MAITLLCGFETGTTDEVDFTTSAGSPTVSTLQARTGSRSFRSGSASAGNIGFTPTLTVNYLHCGIYFPSLPGSNLLILSVNGIQLWLTTGGKLRIATGGTDSSATLSAGTWYWVGVRAVTGTSVVMFQIDGVDQVTGNLTASGTSIQLGPNSTFDIYYDDVVGDDAAFVASAKVSLLVPISDNARGANWFQANATTTTNLWDAVNNVPPAGVASANEAATPLASIQHTGGANNSYDANLSTYAAAGIAAADTIVAVQSFIRCGADIATGTKLLAVGLVSNPAESLSASITLPGVAHPADSATTSTNWVMGRHTATISPSVTLGTSPVLRVNRPETASRVACVDFMGLYVAWRPSAVVTYVPRHGFVNHQNPGVL